MSILRENIKCIDSFTELNLNSLELNKEITSAIYVERDNEFIVIVKKGTVLTEKLSIELEIQDKLYTLNDGLNCITLPMYIKQNSDDIKKCMKYLYKINNKIFSDFFENTSDKIDIFCVESIVNSIIYLINEHKHILKKCMIYFANSNELANHSLHVTIYALVLAHTNKLRREEAIQLGVAALLHDIGMKKIDAQMMDKSAPLNVLELERIQNHVRYSVEYIKHNDIYDPYVIEAVMHHHERYDGSGYPNNLSASKITEFASILAICDVFNAMTNDRPDRKAFTSFQALQMMIKDPGLKNKFNEKYLVKFIKEI